MKIYLQTKVTLMAFYLVGFMAFGAVSPDWKEHRPYLQESQISTGLRGASLDINRVEVLMVKTPRQGTCAVPLTEEFVSNSGVDVDEFYKLLHKDKSYSDFQNKKRELDFSQNFKGGEPVPLCSLEQSEKVLLSFFDGPVQVALEPTTTIVISVVAYYGLCSVMQVRLDNISREEMVSSFTGFVGYVLVQGVCLPATAGVNIPLRIMIKGDLKKNTPYN